MKLALLTRDFWLDTRRRRRDWLGLVALLVLLVVFPIRTNTSDLACIVLAVVVWALGLVVFRSSKLACLFFVGIFVSTVGIAVLPGRPVDPGRMQSAYVDALRSYTGVRYVWGGENSLGIDCSGLVRQGMIMSTMREGVRTMNPGLLRESFYIWRHDCSAAHLGDGYGGRLRPLEETDSLSTLDYSGLRPGDVAVTDGGAHTLAYLGNRTWIEADPGGYAGKVIQVTAGVSRNPWLDVPMRILRWRMLA